MELRQKTPRGGPDSSAIGVPETREVFRNTRNSCGSAAPIAELSGLPAFDGLFPTSIHNLMERQPGRSTGKASGTRNLQAGTILGLEPRLAHR